MRLIKLRIYDLHRKHELIDGETFFIPVQDSEDEKEWKSFDAYFDPSRLQIDFFREDVIFNRDIPVRCTKIVFSDNTFVFGRYTAETFAKFYEEEYLSAMKSES